ncbi:MAG: hypothetical protein ACYCZY_11300 [Lacisediminihabitans sp.]
MAIAKSSEPIASFRVGEKGHVNLPALLRELAMINEEDVLVVSSVANGEIVLRTPAAIRDYIHSGIVDSGIVDEVSGASVPEWRRAVNNRS